MAVNKTAKYTKIWNIVYLQFLIKEIVLHTVSFVTHAPIKGALNCPS